MTTGTIELAQKTGRARAGDATVFQHAGNNEQRGQNGHFLRSGNRSTQMPLVRYYSAFFQDQLQTPHIGDVLKRIGGDHNQVGDLAHLHRAQFGADAADRSAMARGCYQSLPRRGTVRQRSRVLSGISALNSMMPSQ